MIGVVTASTLIALHLLHDQPGDRAEVRHPVPRADDPVSRSTASSATCIWCTRRRAAEARPTMLLTDRPLLLCVALWAAAVVVIVYRPWACDWARRQRVRTAGVPRALAGRSAAGTARASSTMPDFNIRSDSVNVEQIMEQIRARIREKRGVDYTEEQIRELAAVKLETLPRPAAGPLRAARAVPGGRRLAARRTTRSRTRRCSSRTGRRSGSSAGCCRPVLKLFFNPNRLIHVLHLQAEINTTHGAVQPELSLRAAAQPGPRDDAARHRGEEPEDAGRVALEPPRLQRAAGARARGRASMYKARRRRRTPRPRRRSRQAAGQRPRRRASAAGGPAAGSATARRKRRRRRGRRGGGAAPRRRGGRTAGGAAAGRTPRRTGEPGEARAQTRGGAHEPEHREPDGGLAATTGTRPGGPAARRRPRRAVKLAVVVQRYGADINGGAELHARYVAEHLARHAEVEVLTTCARDYVTWRNELPPGARAR